MKLTFEYPVYPTQTQEQTLLGWFDHLCELQNSARDNRKYAHEEEGRFVSRYDQEHLLKVARETYDDFREVPQDFQVSILKRVDKAFDAFRRRCKEGAEKKGYPRYKMRVRSLTWCLRKHKLKTGERVRQNPIRETAWKHDRLKVPKLGEVKIYMHRPLQGDPKEVTLVKKASGWYAHITCELPDTPKVEPTDAIAVDVGTTHYLTTSEGETEDNPRWYRQAEGLLHKHNQTTARRKKGSKRWVRSVDSNATGNAHKRGKRMHRTQPHLTYEGVSNGARQAAQDGFTFDEYCELIAKVVISGQSKDHIKGILMGLGCHLYWMSLEKRMQNNLLIISCSQRKVATPGLLPAIHRYDGPTYRTLRKFLQDGIPPENLDVAILSAKYGLMGCQQPIENYDQRMTAKRADALRLKVQTELQALIEHKRECPFSLGPYDQVFINLGKTYMRTLEGFHWGLLSTLEASGGIGQKTSQMKTWFTRISEE